MSRLEPRPRVASPTERDSNRHSSDTDYARPAHPSLQRRIPVTDVGTVPTVQGITLQSSPFWALA